MANIQKWSSQGYPFGLRLDSPPETLLDGECWSLENWEYSHVNNALRTAYGVTVKHEYTDDIQTLYPYKGKFLYSSGANLRQTDFTADISLGTLAGLERPVYAGWDGNVLIASGGQLQRLISSGTLSVLSNSPLCTFVTDRTGRVLVYHKSSDVVNYSTIGDENGWTNNPSDPSSAQYADVGYKDSNPIAAIDTLANDIVVYKTPSDGEVSGRIYRILGNPTSNDFAVNELTRRAHCFSAVSVKNNAFFVGYGGFLNLQGVIEYGDIGIVESGKNINNYLIQNMDSNARVWLVQSRKQIWIRGQNDKRVYIYHYVPRYQDGRGSFTVRTFEHQLNDVCEVGNQVYIAYGNKIAKLDDTTDKDDGKQIMCSLFGKDSVPSRRFIVIKRSFMAKNLIPGELNFTVGKRTENISFSASSPDIYNNTDDIMGNTNDIMGNGFTEFRDMGGGGNKSVQTSVLVKSGAIELRQLDYDYVEV